MKTAAQVLSSVEELVGRIADEFTQRLNRGERPSVEEYASAFAQDRPEIAALLRELLPALNWLQRPEVAAALADADPLLAAPLGDFRLIREIGRGGMGVVYEARQLSLKERTVAVKVLPFAATLDPRQLQRFKNEAEAAARLHHEHVVPVYCIGCERGVHYYAMQYIEGLSLAALIEKLRRLAGLDPADPQRTAPHLAAPAVGQDTAPVAALTTEGANRSAEFFNTVARLGLEAAQGLAHAHGMGVLHRDIKPANLLVDNRCSLWITDFGLAQVCSDTRLTRTGELLGTVRYMSPEQALAKRVVVDERTDVYSLGATLYELLTLEPVFNGRDRQELLRQIAFDDPRPLRSHNRSIPRDLETIVATAVAKAPAHRYASAGALAMDLRRFLNGEPIKARPEGLPRWVWRKSRRHAAGILLGLSAVITTVILVLFLLHLNRPPEPSTEEEEERRQQAALAAHERNLDLAQKVTLIGERGRPGYSRWRSDTTLAKVVDAPDGAFTVQCWEHGLLELLPDARLQCYRFSADVRHEQQTNQESRVGIYFLHSGHQEGKRVAHFHCNVGFNDLVEVGTRDANGAHRGNAVGVQAHRQYPAGLIRHAFVYPTPEVLFTPARPVGALGPWRKIAVQVRPKTITVYWEESNKVETPRDMLMIGAKWLSRPELPPLRTEPQFAPRNGLGLFVSQGVASFRNVVVEPIGEDN
jgi:serine/threonine protein kinase